MDTATAKFITEMKCKAEQYMHSVIYSVCKIVRQALKQLDMVFV